jgi:hypothetical protein
MSKTDNWFKQAKEAVIVEEFKAYSVKWKCEKGHTNFQTIIGKNSIQHDVCLQCGKHYEFNV